MSAPTLFDKSETSFTTNGLGRLVGSVSCQVTEVGNGLYELEMRYLASDSMYQYLVQDNIIKVKLDDDRGYQCFDIYKVSLPINGIVTVNARHIGYRMNYIPVKPFSATGITATLQGLTNNALEVNPFVLSSDITNETSEYNQIEPKSLKACIGGTDGSILDIFSGSGAVELEYDNFNVHIWNHRGSDNGVQIRYGKNLTGFNYTRNTEESYTGAIGYWHDTYQTVNYYGDVQYNSNVGDYGYKKTVIVDFSEQQDTAPTKSQLNAWALAYITNIGIAKENITVNFVNLADTEEYKDIAPLETVGLFDTVHVFYEPYGLTVEKKVIKTVYDVLNERYISIEIGDKKSNLSSTLIETSATVSKMVSVTQKIDREVGEITTTIGEIEEDVEGVTERVTQVEQTTESITQTVSETATTANSALELANANAGDISDLSGVVSETTQTLQTQIAQNKNAINLKANESTVTTLRSDLEGEISQTKTDLQGEINITNTNVSTLVTRTDTIDGKVDTLGTAFVVEEDGAKVMSVANGGVVTDNYTQIKTDGMHIVVNQTEVAWNTADGSGTPQMTIAPDSDAISGWQFRMDSANRLNINWHS